MSSYGGALAGADVGERRQGHRGERDERNKEEEMREEVGEGW